MKIRNSKKLDGKITILFSEEGLTIELVDWDSGITFAVVKLNQTQACQALSRLSYVDCAEMTVGNLENVGRKYEHDMLEFPLTTRIDHACDGKRIKLLRAEAQKHAPEGWEGDGYFGSQGSFFERDGKPWARCKIYRWVDK